MLDNMLMASSVAGDAHLKSQIKLLSNNFRSGGRGVTSRVSVVSIHPSHLCNVIDISSAK